MVMLGLLAAGVVVVLLAALVWSMRIGRRRSQAQERVSEEEARENAAPLTTAIVSGSRDRDRGSS
jgi:cytochrome c-type biogenesis protein CcmH/NrfF